MTIMTNPSTGSAVESGGGGIPRQTWIKLIVVAALVVVIYLDSLRYTIASRWIHDGNWSHGWLIPLFSLYFLWTKRDAILKAESLPSMWGAVVLLVALSSYFYFLWPLPMGYPRALSLVGVLVGLVLLLGGWRILKLTWFPIAFLLLAIPLPQRIYVALTMPQQKLASMAAAMIMPLVTPGLYTDASGVVIDYTMPGRPSGQLNVEEACSGMRSMMAIVTLGVAMAYLGDKPLWQRLVLLATCVPIAILCNMIRVTLTGLFFIHGYEGLAKGTPHQILGLAMLALALGMYSAVGWVLAKLFVDGPDENLPQIA